MDNGHTYEVSTDSYQAGPYPDPFVNPIIATIANWTSLSLFYSIWTVRLPLSRKSL